MGSIAINTLTYETMDSKLEALERIIQTLNDKVLGAIIAASVTAVVAIISLWYNFASLKKQVKEKRNEEKRKEINQKLNDFYGPIQSYLSASKELFKMFSKGKPKEFRTLTYLLAPDQEYDFGNGIKNKVTLNQVDKDLLNEIIEVGKSIEKLIVEKAGLVDDVELRYNYIPNPAITDVKLEGNGLLTFAKVHFQIIRLANEGKLKGDLERFKDYVFPKELPLKIEDKIKQLQEELRKISS